MDFVAGEPVITAARAYEADAVSWHRANSSVERRITRADSYRRSAAQRPPGALSSTSAVASA